LVMLTLQGRRSDIYPRRPESSRDRRTFADPTQPCPAAPLDDCAALREGRPGGTPKSESENKGSGSGKEHVMHEDPGQPDLVGRVQREIAARMRELDMAIDAYAKLVVELELLELQARSSEVSTHPDQQSQ
jgi:hypothetical protein